MDQRLLVEIIQRHFAQQPEAGMLRTRLYLALRQAILGRELAAGECLPGTRSLARDLALGRNTVLWAYDQLLSEGYLEGQSGTGTFVSDALRSDKAAPPRRLIGTRREGISKRGALIGVDAASSRIQQGAFMPGVPDVEHFPFKVWNRLLARYHGPGHSALMQYGHGGYGPLKVALAEYLNVTRMLQCSPRQIVIINGSHQAFDLCARMLCDHGDLAWVEEPGYWGARNVLRAAGLRLQAVPLDERGIAPTDAHWATPPRLIMVTPSSQYPTGIVLSLDRRLQLLERVEECGGWIVEDDYDNELRYHDHPVTSLFGLSQSRRVIYLGTLSKVLFPGMRMSYMVVPEDMVEAFTLGNAELYREGRLAEQAALAEFIEAGHFTAHIRRMRAIYQERRDVLHETLDSRLRGLVHSPLTQAGLQSLYTLNGPADDVQLAHEALQRRIVTRPLSIYYADPPRDVAGLNLGFASVPVEAIRPAAIQLAEVIESHMTARRGNPLRPAA
ncbi:MocR-like pyridoxine biosynthesis transcription factor PdxR [Derxia lacustris]|uniref:MocR-like pyridoxine biosynthesis transcription factor PdxR n=1 Tax=Derxia lacustris TaxID=764842 RepID=UPI000A176890|nr:PLP-dependent aminotransferase family protein [Derxia lacustris]